MRTASEILDEIRRIKGLKSDAALGALLGGVSQSTVGSWRGRNSIPYEEIISFCDKENISIDSLIKGERQKQDTVAEDNESYKKAVNPRTAALAANFEALREEDKRALERIALTLAQCRKTMKKAG